MSEQFRTMEQSEVDLRAVFGAVGRRLPLLIIVALLIGAATFAMLRLVDPLYRAEVTVLIETNESDLIRADEALTTTLLDTEGIASQVELIRSRDVALAVIAELGLTTIAEFDPAQAEPSLMDRILGLVGLGGEPSELPVEELVLADFRDRLSVNSIADTRVISISFTAADPQLAADIANAVAAQYVRIQRESRLRTTSDATAWLEEEITALSERVIEAEAAVETYRAQQDLFLAGGTTPMTLVAQRLADISAELSRVQSARAEAESKAALIRANLETGAALNSLDVLNSTLIQNLREQQVLLRAQIAEASATYLPGHPQIRALNAQLEDLDDAIRTEANNIMLGFENEAALARGYEAELNAQLDDLRAAAAESNQAEVQLRALERVADAEGQLLETYLALVREAVSRQNSGFVPVNVRVISPAAAPLEAYYPKPMSMTAIAIIITLMLGAAILLVRELASGRALRPVHQRSLPGTRVVGRVRWDESSDVRRMMPHEPADPSALAGQIEQSLAAVVQKVRDTNTRRVVITTADGASGDGRPLAAVALARTMARGGNRVLLVDLHADDADRVAMGEEKELPGFGDLFAGEASFAQVIFRDRSSPAHYIPTGKNIDPKDEHRLSTLTEALEQTYDCVLYDIGNELISALAPGAGAALIVTEEEPDDPPKIAVYKDIKSVTEAEILWLVTAPPPMSEQGAAA